MTDKKDFEEAYKEAYHFWQPSIMQQNVDLRYYQSDQWNDEDLSKFKRQGRDPLVFNRLKKVADIVSGYEHRNRLVLNITPIGGEDDAACSQFNKILPVVMNYNGYEIISEAFLYGPCVTGSNLIEFWPNEDNEFEFHRWAHNSFLLSPTLTKKDLSDCDYVILGKMVTKEDAIENFPDASRTIKSIDSDMKSGEEAVMPDLPHKNIKQGKKRHKMCYFWQREKKKGKVLINRYSGQKIPWRRSEKELKIFMERLGLYFAVVSKRIRTVKLDVFLDGVRISNTYKDPYELGDYNFAWMPGMFSYEQNRADLKLQGIIRVARDAQITDNRRLMSMIDILESQAYSGDDFEEGALIDDEDAFKSGAGQARFFNEGKLKDGVKYRQHKDIPAGMFQLHQIVNDMLIDLPGLNQEIIGSEDKEVPGILSKLRTGAALTIMQSSFDNLRFAKKIIGRKLVKMIQKNWPTQKITRITNEKLAPGFRDPDFTKFDCTPREGLLTASQREMAYAELKSLKEQGWPIPYSAIIDVAPLAMKSNLKKHVQQAEAEQAKLQQLEMNQQKILQAMQRAKLMEDMASAEEKRTQASENIANAQLDKIKAAKEIQQMDFEKMMGIIDRLKDLADTESQNSRNQLTRR